MPEEALVPWIDEPEFDDGFPFVHRIRQMLCEESILHIGFGTGTDFKKKRDEAASRGGSGNK
jgi:hypothetical protein